MDTQLEQWAETVGVVIIGRNEGARLERCLESLQRSAKCLVYVDSGSTDDSVVMAKGLGTDVVNLDISKPFTAARARNAGYERLISICPGLSYVQFVDGDCEIVDGWIETAVKFLNENSEYAVACGRRRERHPDETTYNRLCDMEWNSPVGDAANCGGDSLIRTKTLQEVGVFDPTFIAGEEPEMCYRFRQEGWKIYRLDHEMTLHDAGMTLFSQWWKRAVRSGHAYAEGQAHHGQTFGGYYARDVWSILFWANFVPLVGVSLAYWTKGVSLFLFVGYAYLWWRIYSYRLRRGDKADEAKLYTNYCVLGKFPQLVGVLRYWKNKIIGHRSRIIEYK